MKARACFVAFLVTIPLIGGKSPERAIAADPPTRKAKGSREKEITRLEEELEILKAEVTRLQRQVGTLSKRSTTLAIQDGTVLESGSVVFEKGRTYHRKKIHFVNQYASPPLVIACESGTAGTWVPVKSQRITTTEAEIAVRGNFHYHCRIGYIVIGEGTLRDGRKARDRKKVNPSAKIRLTEDRRKQIYREIVEAEYKAMYEADQKYPALNLVNPSFSHKKAKRRSEKRRSLERTLTKRYVAEVAKKYGIRGQKVDQIQMEGETKSWPMPPWEHGPPSMEEWP